MKLNVKMCENSRSYEEMELIEMMNQREDGVELGVFNENCIATPGIENFHIFLPCR